MILENDSKAQGRAGNARLWLAVTFVTVFSTSCQKPFDVNVKADEPIKVDLSMDVHVYQHGGATIKKTGEKEEEVDIEAADFKEVTERRRDRMADIQTLKNDRIIGENHAGLLSLISEGDTKLWPEQYVRETIKAENDDRSYLISYEAGKRNKPPFEIEKEQWMHQQRKSHPGEWIEVSDPNHAGEYLWIQKKSPASARN